MTDLNSIPWKDLNCAYGSSERVNEVLLQIRSGNCNQELIDELYGCVCHQGTIYEVTSHVIGILYDLILDESFSRRGDLLFLVGAIARASSKNDPHSIQCRSSIASRLEDIVPLTQRNELRIAAAYALNDFSGSSPLILPLLRNLITLENRSKHKAALILLLGETGNSSPETHDLVIACLLGRKTPARHAAAVSFARLRLRPVTKLAKKCIVAAISDNFECDLIPWGIGERFSDSSVADNLGDLKSCLSAEDIDKLVSDLCIEIERTGGGYSSLSLLLDLLLARNSQALTSAGISEYQRKVLSTVFGFIEPSSFDNLFDFTPWGLPRSRRARRSVLSGAAVSAPDASLPLLSLAESPRIPFAFELLTAGMRVHHRNLGAGEVLEVERNHGVIMAKVEFDLEGKLTISDRGKK